MVLHVSNHGTFSMRLHFNLWSISQQIRSCYADQHALIGILRYMYMPWPLNSWGNDGVSAYSYWIKVPIPTWPIMIHHDASWPIMILDFYADSIWFCCFFSSFFAGELALRGGDLAASATNIATDLVAGLRCLAPCSRSVHSIIELNWLWCQSLWFLKLYVKKYDIYIYIYIIIYTCMKFIYIIILKRNPSKIKNLGNSSHPVAVDLETGSPKDLCRDLALAGWLCFSEARWPWLVGRLKSNNYV